MAATPDDQLRSMIANLEERTMVGHRVRITAPEAVADGARGWPEAACRDA